MTPIPPYKSAKVLESLGLGLYLVCKVLILQVHTLQSIPSK